MSSPVVIVVQKEEIKMIEEIVKNLNKKIIILIVKETKNEDEPAKKIQDHFVKYTTELSFTEDMDKALEEYVFFYLERAKKDILQSGRSEVFILTPK